jgi:hypothetical protein
MQYISICIKEYEMLVFWQALQKQNYLAKWSHRNINPVFWGRETKIICWQEC